VSGISLPKGFKIPANEKGLGKLITAPGSPDLIPGVKVHALTIHPDDRGYFLELARLGSGAVSEFPAQSQVSAALSYSGTIKAFHYHQRQYDYWTPALGMLQVALVDLREDSPTFGLRNTLYLGKLRSWSLVIPPGVGHGYKVIGPEPAMLVYLTSNYYDPADEGRIPYNDPGIHYDWEIQHK
jgi:dTDP-4-dehydrorhamnose 3,5-epimerase